MLKHKIGESSCRVLLVIALLAGAAALGLAATGAVGSVTGSMNASVGGQALLPNTTIFSGDNLQVQDGVAVVAIGANNRMVFGRNTAASFLRDPSQVTVTLGQGNLTMLHSADGTPLRVKAEEVLIMPASGLKTVGDIAVLSDSVVITAKEGRLQVDDHGVMKDVMKGQTIVIEPSAAKGNGGAVAAARGSSALAAGTAAVAAPGATAATGVSATPGAMGAANFMRPGSSRPLSPASAAGLAGTASVITNGNAPCAPPGPGHLPTASTVVPFSGNAAPICP